jgi:hypothetical protein
MSRSASPRMPSCRKMSRSRSACTTITFSRTSASLFRSKPLVLGVSLARVSIPLYREMIGVSMRSPAEANR